MVDTTTGFTLVRQLDATPEQIWAAWTDPDEATQWLHPRGLVTPRESISFDVVAGGTYSYTMVEEVDGREFPTAGIYREVVPNKKLVFTWGNVDDADDDRLLITLTIDDLGELTRFTFDLRGYDGMSGDGNVYDGWEEALDSLSAHLAGRGATG